MLNTLLLNKWVNIYWGCENIILDKIWSLASSNSYSNLSTTLAFGLTAVVTGILSFHSYFYTLPFQRSPRTKTVMRNPSHFAELLLHTHHRWDSLTLWRSGHVELALQMAHGPRSRGCGARTALTKWPHIRLAAIATEREDFWGCPLHWEFGACGTGVLIIKDEP